MQSFKVVASLVFELQQKTDGGVEPPLQCACNQSCSTIKAKAQLKLTTKVRYDLCHAEPSMLVGIGTIVPALPACHTFLCTYTVHSVHDVFLVHICQDKILVEVNAVLTRFWRWLARTTGRLRSLSIRFPSSPDCYLFMRAATGARGAVTA